MLTRLLLLSSALLLAACGSQPPRPVESRGETPAPILKPTERIAVPQKRGGGYYMDDGPGENEPAPEVLAAIPDAIPRIEPLHRFANNPYSVLGKDYTPMKSIKPYKVTGIGSWYGKKFHGQKTSSGEAYDMYAMTAAHPTLPIPSYVRVTSASNGKSVVVRVNDRGPFHSDRVIDLSYTAAWKLGYIGTGSGRVTVELIQPGSDMMLAKTEAAPVPVKAAEPILAKPTPEPVLSEAAPAPPGAYVQLGAFGNPDNAESFRSHMAREFDELSDRMRLEPGGKVMRVQAGPFRDRAEAEAQAEKIRAATGVKPTIVMR